MKTLARKISIAIIIVGVCMLAINFLYGESTITLIHKEHIPNTNVYWYKLDMQDYILNIRNSFQEAIYLNIEPVPQNWISNATIDQYVNNNIPYIVNWVALILNILIMPVRIIFYILKGTLALMGIRVLNMSENNPIYWLIKICNWVIKEMIIPYIQ